MVTRKPLDLVFSVRVGVGLQTMKNKKEIFESLRNDLMRARMAITILEQKLKILEEKIDEN